MEPDALCAKIGTWFQTHKDEEPFTFGEVHLITGEPEADILLVIGKLDAESGTASTNTEQWENTTYDAPVTWLWWQLANEEADNWLRAIYDHRFADIKRQMLQALLDLAELIEGQGYSLDWEPEETETVKTTIYINRIPGEPPRETERWRRLLADHTGTV